MPQPQKPHAANVCPQCGKLLSQHAPHSLETCVQELHHCRTISTDALKKIEALIRAFTHDPRILNRMSLIIKQAFDEIGAICEKTPKVKVTTD